jgi:hypothetical protein
MIDTKTMMVVVHEEVNSVEKKKDNKLGGMFMQGAIKNENPPPHRRYDQTSKTEDFWFPHHKPGRGSKVETLPGGESIGGFGDLEYFREKLQKATGVQAASEAKKVAMMNDLIAPPTECAPMTQKTPAGIDFSSMSGIDVAKAQEWNRGSSNYRSSYYAIDVNAAMQESILNAERESIIETTTKRLQELAEQVMYDGLVGTAATEPTTKALTMNELQELQDKYKDWTCGTSGWSDEFTLTDWDIGMPSMNKDDCTWSVAASMSAYNPYPFTPYKANESAVVAMEEIEFTEEDLSELADLINERNSEVMKFA